MSVSKFSMLLLQRRQCLDLRGHPAKLAIYEAELIEVANGALQVIATSAMSAGRSKDYPGHLV